jgi:hypothetical protein
MAAGLHSAAAPVRLGQVIAHDEEDFAFGMFGAEPDSGQAGEAFRDQVRVVADLDGQHAAGIEVPARISWYTLTPARVLSTTARA